MLRSVFNIQYPVFSHQYSEFGIKYSVFSIQYSILTIQYSDFEFSIQYSCLEFRIHYSLLRINYTTTLHEATIVLLWRLFYEKEAQYRSMCQSQWSHTYTIILRNLPPPYVAYLPHRQSPAHHPHRPTSTALHVYICPNLLINIACKWNKVQWSPHHAKPTSNRILHIWAYF